VPAERRGELVWEPTMPQRAALVEAAGAGLSIHKHRPRQADVLGVLDAWLQRLMEGGA